MPAATETSGSLTVAGECENCGYELAAEGACPECGMDWPSVAAGLKARRWRVEEVRRGALLVMWFVPLTVFAYAAYLVADSFLQAAGHMAEGTVLIVAAFVPALLVLAGAWMMGAPVEGERAGWGQRNVFRLICAALVIALCSLLAQKLAARAAFVRVNTPAGIKTALSGAWPLWALLCLSPIFAALLQARAAALMGLFGRARAADAWMRVAVIAGVVLVLLIVSDRVADWLWNSPPHYKLLSGPAGTTTTTPLPGSPGVYDPGRFAFVRMILCGFAAAWGCVIWMSVAGVRARLGRGLGVER